MIATVKIIPFAVGEARARCGAGGGRKAKPLVRVAPYRIRKVGVVSTLLPGLAAKVVEKTLQGHRRAARAGRRAHRRRAARAARAGRAGEGDRRGAASDGAELVIVFGASAIADRRDVIPAAIEAIGGTHRAFRHAGRSRQPAADRRRARPAGARRAGLRALAEGKRLRLGADAAARRPAGVARGHHRHGRRRAADGDRHAAAAARRSRSPDGRSASPPSCWPPAARPAWAGRTSCSPRSAASRWCASPPRRRWPRARSR